VIAADAFVDEWHADLIYRLDRMLCIDLARAITRPGISPEEIAAIVHRFDLLRDNSDEEAVL
jgi:hypothetical protein